MQAGSIAARSLLRAQPRVRLLVAVSSVALLLGLFAVANASAAPEWTTSCGDPTNLDVAVCERLSYMAEQQDALLVEAQDHDRSDLAAWGVWFVAGVLLVSLFAPRWHGSWRFWRG
jgi:hypothetical protein